MFRIIRLVIAQRLVRALCPNCKVPFTPSRRERDLAGIDAQTIYRPGKCVKCYNTGYNGRLPVTEVLTLDTPLRERLKEAGSRREVVSILDGLLLPSLQDSAYAYVAEGLTDIDEVVRVIGSSDAPPG